MSNKLTDIRAKKMLISNVFLRSSRLMYYIFLNIFIWKQTSDIQIIALFNMAYVTTHFISFISFAPLVKKGYTKIIHKISILGLMATYSIFMILGDNILEYIYILSATMGVFNGIYRINFHTVQFSVTTFANRGNFAGLKSSLYKVSSIIVPSILGFLISGNFFGYSYESGFLFSIFLLIGSLYFGNIGIETLKDTKLRLGKIFKKSLRDGEIRSSLLSYSMTSFSFGNTLLEVLMGIFIFNHLQSEDQFGYSLSILTIFSIFGLYLFGKFVQYKSYKKSFIFIGVLYSLTLLLFISIESFLVLMICATLIKIFQSLYSIPQKVISDNVLHKIKNYKSYRSEYIVLREGFIYFGWISSFTTLYLVDSIAHDKLVYLFIAIIFLMIISTYLLSKIDITKIENK